jgi:hypothetical protein
LAESFGELEGADGSSGLTTGEQPSGGARNADGGVSAPGADQFADEVGEGRRERDRFAAQLDAGVVVADLDVVERQTGDHGGCWA